MNLIEAGRALKTYIPHFPSQLERCRNLLSAFTMCHSACG